MAADPAGSGIPIPADGAATHEDIDMTTRKPRARRVNPTPVATSQPVRKLFLAGLGAVALAQKQGEKVVSTLIAEGEDLRARTIRFTRTVEHDVRRAVTGAGHRVKRAVAPVRRRAERVVGELEAGLGERVGGLLGRFGVPSKGDVEELVARVAELNRQVRASSRRQPRA